MDLRERIRILRRRGFTQHEIAAILDLEPEAIRDAALAPDETPVRHSGFYEGRLEWTGTAACAPGATTLVEVGDVPDTSQLVGHVRVGVWLESDDLSQTWTYLEHPTRLQGNYYSADHVGAGSLGSGPADDQLYWVEPDGGDPAAATPPYVGRFRSSASLDLAGRTYVGLVPAAGTWRLAVWTDVPATVRAVVLVFDPEPLPGAPLPDIHEGKTWFKHESTGITDPTVVVDAGPLRLDSEGYPWPKLALELRGGLQVTGDHGIAGSFDGMPATHGLGAMLWLLSRAGPDGRYGGVVVEEVTNPDDDWRPFGDRDSQHAFTALARTLTEYHVRPFVVRMSGRTTIEVINDVLPLAVTGNRQGAQTKNLAEFRQAPGGGPKSGVLRGGAPFVAVDAEPADAELSAGQLAFWFDKTNGAASLRVKAKTANGTVVRGTLALA